MASRHLHTVGSGRKTVGPQKIPVLYSEVPLVVVVVVVVVVVYLHDNNQISYRYEHNHKLTPCKQGPHRSPQLIF